ncbi:MAG: DUF1922 domain-containing protein [Candidatus Helarchaeota archaeon]
MKPFLIFMCQKCGTPYYCKRTQKTKTCFKCGHRIQIRSARILTYADSVVEARYLVEAYKVPESRRDEIIQLIAESKSKKPANNKTIFENFIREQVSRREKNIIPETLFYQILNEKGITDDWIKQELDRLARMGLMIRPEKGKLQFIT